MAEKEAIVLVHGLWMSGLEMGLLEQRLRRGGYLTTRFRYPSVTHAIAQNSAALNRFLLTVPGERLHFVAHSLGGLVVRQLLHDFPEQRSGRVVTLGTPHQRSLAAAVLSLNPLLNRLLGKGGEALTSSLPPWQGARDLGSIAGTLPLGMGALLTRLPRPHDGVVTVTETCLPRMGDHLLLKSNHFGLLFSAKVAQETLFFLKNGHFSPRDRIYTQDT
ncbi:MAG: alpha/beta hydrolase [Gammaproteobacteria bacterium]|nr:alpha/beta hydrolase [Gammaproteobacteria bacterium]